MEKAKSRGLIEIRDWRAGKVEKGNCVYLFANVAFHDVPVSPVSRMFAGILCIGMACTRCDYVRVSANVLLWRRSSGRICTPLFCRLYDEDGAVDVLSQAASC